MVEASAVSETPKDRVEQIGIADLVIGLVEVKSGDELRSVFGTAQEALSLLTQPVRAVLAYRAEGDRETRTDPAWADDHPELRLVPFTLPAIDPSAALTQTTVESFRAIVNIGQRVGSRACAMIATSAPAISVDWIRRLVEPLLEREFDLIAPIYTHHRFESLLNVSVLSPLYTALFGKHLAYPFGPDFGLSARLLRLVHGRLQPKAANGSAPPFFSVSAEAISHNLRLGQAHLGARGPVALETQDLSSVIAQILGPVFSEVERNAPLWQRIRGAEVVPVFGTPLAPAEETGAIDVKRLLDSFQLGFRNLQEIWSLALPPASLFELRKIGRLPAEQFLLPDPLWARIIYDFALAYHLRTINRDHLLRAMTPLYLGWIASYALEIDSASAATVEQRFARLGQAFEAEKPYLVQRWRWPDRFNP